MVFVVDGLEHALQLPRGTAVDHQDKSDSDRVGQHVLHRILVPLDVLVGFAWGKPERPQGWVRISSSFGGRFPDASSWGLLKGHNSVIGP